MFYGGYDAQAGAAGQGAARPPDYKGVKLRRQR